MMMHCCFRSTSLLLLCVVVLLCGLSEAQHEYNRFFGGTGDEIVKSLIVESDGSSVAIGTTTTWNGVSPACMIVKRNSAGAIVFAKSFHGAAEESCGMVIKSDATGDYLVTGHSNSYGDADDDWFLTAWDSSTGVLNWVKKYDMGNVGTADERLEVLANSAGGGLIACGYSNNVGSGDYDFLFMKLDDAGDHSLQRAYGGGAYDICGQAMDAPDGGYMLGGLTASYGNGGPYDVLIIKIQTDGTLDFSKAYGGAGSEILCGMATTPADDGYYVAFDGPYGSGSGDFVLMNIDLTGTIVFSKAYGGSLVEDILAMSVSADTVILAGDSAGCNGAGGGVSDMVVVWLELDGTIRHNLMYGGAGVEEVWDVKQDASGNVWAGGYCDGLGAVGKDGFVSNLASDARSPCWQACSFNTVTETISSTVASPVGISYNVAPTSPAVGVTDISGLLTDYLPCDGLLPSMTASQTPSSSQTASQTASKSVTASQSASQSPSQSRTASTSSTKSVSSSQTASSSQTPTHSVSPTSSSSSSATDSCTTRQEKICFDSATCVVDSSVSRGFFCDCASLNDALATGFACNVTIDAGKSLDFGNCVGCAELFVCSGKSAFVEDLPGELASIWCGCSPSVEQESRFVVLQSGPGDDGEVCAEILILPPRSSNRPNLPANQTAAAIGQFVQTELESSPDVTVLANRPVSILPAVDGNNDPSTSGENGKLPLIIGLAVGCFVLVLLITWYFIHQRIRNRERHKVAHIGHMYAA